MHSQLLTSCYFVEWAICGAGNQLSLNLYRHPVTKQTLPGTVNPLWHWLVGSHYLRRRITRPLDVGGFSSWWGSRTGRLSDLKEPGISSCPDLRLLPLGLSLLSPIQMEAITDNRTLSWQNEPHSYSNAWSWPVWLCINWRGYLSSGNMRNGKKIVAFCFKMRYQHLFGKPEELQEGQPIPVLTTFGFLPHNESMLRQTLPMPHPLALASNKNKTYKCPVQRWWVWRRWKKFCIVRSLRFFTIHKNSTMDTIHMQLNLLIFSPWPFKFHVPSVVREMVSLNAHYCTIVSLLDEKEVHYWDSNVPSVKC